MRRPSCWPTAGACAAGQYRGTFGSMSSDQTSIPPAMEVALRPRFRRKTAAFIDRLTLSDKVMAAMVQGLKEVAALPDPVGAVTSMWVRPNGLLVGRQRLLACLWVGLT